MSEQLGLPAGDKGRTAASNWPPGLLYAHPESGPGEGKHSRGPGGTAGIRAAISEWKQG